MEEMKIVENEKKKTKNTQNQNQTVEKLNFFGK